jgi:hypothetical protein
MISRTVILPRTPATAFANETSLSLTGRIISSSALPLSDYLSGVEGLSPGSTILPR